MAGKKQTSAADVRPEHYGGESNPFEPIKIIQHYSLDFELGNAIKYILRAGKKDHTKKTEDICKAITYLNFELNKLSK